MRSGIKNLEEFKSTFFTKKCHGIPDNDMSPESSPDND